MNQLELQYQYMKNRQMMSKMCLETGTASYDFWDLFHKQFFLRLQIQGELLIKDSSYIDRYDGCEICYPQQSDNPKEGKWIVLVFHELTRTGAPIVLLDLGIELMKMGYFVIALAHKDDGLKKDILKAGIPVIMNPSVRKEDIDSWETFAFDGLVEHASLTVVCTCVLVNWIRRYNGSDHKILWWLHEASASLHDFARRFPKKIHENVRMYCVGEYVRQWLLRYGKQYQAEVFNYGVHDILEGKEPVIREDQKVKFVMVGTLTKRKAQDIFVKAIELLPESYMEQAEFTIIGKKTLQPCVKMVEELAKKEENVQYIQELPRDEIFKLYREIDCVVCPSREDPMPVVLTEAMALEKTCICSDETGTKAFIQDGVNGFVCRSNDAQDLSDKMKYVIDHRKDLPRIGKEGRKIYQREFSIDSFRRRIKKQIIEQIIEEGTQDES